MDIVQMVLAGKVNKDLVQRLEHARRPGRGPVRPGRRQTCSKSRPAWETDLGFVGDIHGRQRQTYSSNSLGQRLPCPVVATVGGGVSTGKCTTSTPTSPPPASPRPWERMKLILMTDVRGLLRDKDDENTLIPVVNVSDVQQLEARGHHLRRDDPQRSTAAWTRCAGAWAGPISSTGGRPTPSWWSCSPTRASAPCSIKSVAGRDMPRTPL